MRDSSSMAPLTLQDQVKQRLHAAIADGSYRPGDKLPSETELIGAFGVSRVTVRAALAALVDEGVLIKRQGKGTFVRQQQVYRESVFANGSFTDTCHKMNAKPSTRIVYAAKESVGEDLFERLNVTDFSHEVVRIDRLRLVDDVPGILETDYLPDTFDFLLDMDLNDTSLLKVIRERRGAVAASFTDSFFITNATDEQAELLDCEPGDALLLVEEVVADSADNPIYINHQIINPDNYIYSVQSSK